MVTLTNSLSSSLTNEANKTSSFSIDLAYYKDPDLLIKEYFASSSSQRAISRKTIINHIKSELEVAEIMQHGSSGQYRDSYDGAVNLLAELDSLKILENLTRFYLDKNIPETYWEILIKTIACAYKINPEQRFSLIFDVILPRSKKRMIKATIIDALLIISDEIDIECIKKSLESFTADKDQYICVYANEALQEIN